MMTATAAATIEIMRGCEAVQDLSPWNDRHYLNLYGFKSSWAGDRNSKLWIDANGVLMRDGSKGMQSPEFAASYQQALAHAKSNGVRIVVC